VQRRCQTILLLLSLLGAVVCFSTRSNLAAAARQAVREGRPSLPDGAFGWDELSPGVGCSFLSDNRLVWISDDGNHWVEITPPRSPGEVVVTSYFLDATRGWAVITDNSPPDEFHGVRVVRTIDGGRTWVGSHFDRSSFRDLQRAIAVPKALWFVDGDHGWLEWKESTSSAFDVGLLFSTVDGGKTWRELPIPNGGELRFYSRKVGWLVGGGSDQNLYVTRDGGETWKEVSVRAPSNCDKCSPDFSLPKFRGGSNGTLRVVFRDDSNIQGRYVASTYVTRDGGHSWNAVSSREQSSRPEPEATAPPEWYHCQVP
jgi:photosystem II stability/assembly factor-like uncharacterized protein